MANDKCPKCGADSIEISKVRFVGRYECGSSLWPSGYLEDSSHCRTRCELAELKERHQRLVEAARKVSSHIYSVDVDFDYFKKTLQDLAKVIETEPSNETKPSERGCPFDEAMESEAKQ